MRKVSELWKTTNKINIPMALTRANPSFQYCIVPSADTLKACYENTASIGYCSLLVLGQIAESKESGEALRAMPHHDLETRDRLVAALQPLGM